MEQITIEMIPFEYVDEIRFHFNSGRTYTHASINLTETKVEELVEKISFASKDELNAIEYIIDLDRVHTLVSKEVKTLIEGSKE